MSWKYLQRPMQKSRFLFPINLLFFYIPQYSQSLLSPPQNNLKQSRLEGEHAQQPYVALAFPKYVVWILLETNGRTGITYEETKLHFHQKLISFFLGTWLTSRFGSVSLWARRFKEKNQLFCHRRKLTEAELHSPCREIWLYVDVRGTICISFRLGGAVLRRQRGLEETHLLVG